MDITARVGEIRRRFDGLGMTQDTPYSRHDILSKLLELQSVLQGDASALVESIRGYRDFPNRNAFRILFTYADSMGLTDLPAYASLREYIRRMECVIPILINGAKGSANTRRVLLPLVQSCGAVLLSDVCLNNGSIKSECDAIVITPYGVFCIETKYFGKPYVLTEEGYLVTEMDYAAGAEHKCLNILERLSAKEQLIREALGRELTVPYYNILLLANANGSFRDLCGKIQVEYHHTLEAAICAMEQHCPYQLEQEDLYAMEDAIHAASVPGLSYCGVDTAGLVNAYVEVAARMEAISQGIPSEEITFCL